MRNALTGLQLAALAAGMVFTPIQPPVQSPAS